MDGTARPGRVTSRCCGRRRAGRTRCGEPQNKAARCVSCTPEEGVPEQVTGTSTVTPEVGCVSLHSHSGIFNNTTAHRYSADSLDVSKGACTLVQREALESSRASSTTEPPNDLHRDAPHVAFSVNRAPIAKSSSQTQLKCGPRGSSDAVTYET